MKQRTKGFTLIELLIVVGVIAILAGIVLVSLRGAKERGEYAKAMRNAATNNRLLVCGEGKMMDLNGNTYKTVEIDGLCWMAENLRYLPQVDTEYNDTKNPRYYVYGYTGADVEVAKSQPNYTKYGVLYNYPAAETACPPGTHLPSDEEWHSLESFFATGVCNPDRPNESADVTYQCQEAGYMLKATSTWNTWSGNSGNGSNDSGFNAFAAGRRDTRGNFDFLGTRTFFWSVEPSASASPVVRSLRESQLGVRRYVDGRAFGFSVRCVQ